jgi:type I restriction enzyme S subunit
MLKGYREYKETEIPWLQEMPSHWHSQRAKTMYTKMNRLVDKNDDVVTCFRDGVVTLRKNRRTTGFTESIKEIGYQGIKKGDLVIHVMDAFAGATGVSDSNGKGTPVYTVCMANGDFNNYYYAFVVREMAKRGFIQSLYRGIRERSSDFRYEVFGKQLLPILPRSEQDQIVRYLDWKVSLINKYVNAKKKQIELLKEQKQAIINEAVTKGLDLNAPMKNSGIEWLGKIPVHWEIRRLKTLGIARNGVMFEPKDLNDYGTLVLRSSNIKNNQLVFDDNIYVKMPIKNNFILRENDLLICSRNGSRELIGKCALIDKQTAGQTYGAFMCIFRGMNNEYIYYVFQSNILNHYLGTFATSTINQLTNSNLYSITIPFPNEEERKDIIIFLRKQCSIFNDLINKFNSEIVIMQEYRTRLISDIVTGRVDVQDVKVPEFAVESGELTDIEQGTEGENNGE